MDTATKNALTAIAQREKISLAQVDKLAQSEANRTGQPNQPRSEFAAYYSNLSLGGVIDAYNASNPASKIIPGRAKLMEMGMIAVAVLVAAAIGYVAWKKFKK